MLDKRSEALLRIINEECREGTYKVLEIEDILRAMPKKFKIDSEGIFQLMSYLSSGDYISLKYKDEVVYCVSPLPRGRKVFEIEEDEKRLQKRKKLKSFIFFISIFVFSFGAMLLATYISKKFF